MKFSKYFELLSYFQNRPSSKQLLVQSQPWKHYKKMLNMFEANKKTMLL